MVILPSASMFSFEVSFEKFEGFASNLLKNLQGAFHSRAPGSLWELSFLGKAILNELYKLQIIVYNQLVLFKSKDKRSTIIVSLQLW